MPDRNWKEYNEAPVRRGEILLDMDFIDTWPDELAKMNDGKVRETIRLPEIADKTTGNYACVFAAIRAVGRTCIDESYRFEGTGSVETIP